AAADDPASQLLRSQAISNLQGFLSEASRITAALSDLQKQADTRIGADVSQTNSLLQQIDSLNADIIRAKSVGADSTGSENIQNNLINQLSELMNVQVQARPGGGVVVRTVDGTELAGDGAATISYVRSDTAVGYLQVTAYGASAPSLTALITGGELRGLLDLRDRQLPGLSDQLGEFVSAAVDEINRAHNASSAVPAPATLTGSNIGLDLPTAISGFSGTSTVAIVDPTGVVQHTVAIDFTAGTMSLDGGAAAAFTPATFLASLNAQLGANGSASFSNGVLSISAAGGNGVAIADDATTPSMKAGKGFSQFFGLNDLIRSTGFSYETGLSATDPHGFTAGDQIQLRLTDSTGARVRDLTISVPAGGTMQDLLDALNDNATGVGLYGQFTLDAYGRMTFASTPSANVTLSVLSDQTSRGAGGPSMSELFGIGAQERGGQASRYSIDSAIQQNPSRLAFAQLDLTVPAGTPGLALGDGRGAVALALAGDVTTSFGAAGDFGALSMTVSRYASEFSGAIGRKAANADSARTNALSVQSEADSRRQSVEGVNLDEELVNMTTYQQAFNASARVIQAAKDMYDVLVGMV
ncbi:MAG TPA: flagellar basal body rod C-terminal domain-containing protein, partial [Caulobacteraceae bacterium]|nr:flagellar basal body rod C-terminal domain-containing protein [Caulobacteraceae bacterium]